ncbi:MAG: LamG-like jellyroll fold domain-containing protein, partial [Deltaproteobacteria bacterium]
GAPGCSNAFAEAVLFDSPTAYYPMDESAGTVMDDAVPNPNPVPGSYGSEVVLGRPGLVPSSVETAPHFPGGVYAAADVAQAPQSSQFQAASAFGVELIVGEDAVNPGTVGDGFVDLATDEWSVQLDPKNLLHLWLPTSAMNIQVTGKTSLTPGVPHLVDATYDGTTASLYLDGQLEGTAQGSGNLDFSMLKGTGLAVAGAPLSPQRATLQGQIAQLSLYDAVLSPARIAAHYHAAGLDGSASCRSLGGSTSGGGTGSTSGGSGASSGGASSSGGSGGSSPNYPRLGSLLISTTGAAQGQSVQGNGYDQGYVQWASKIKVNVIGANWAGAGTGMYGATREAFVEAVHSKSTIGAQVFEYFVTDNNHELFPLTSVDNWLLYQVGTSGTCSPNGYDASWCNTNQTLYEPADSNGLHLEGEMAQAILSTYVNGTGVDAAPSLDGTFHDNTILNPTVAGDYERNGTTQQPGNATVGQSLRDGFAEGYGYLHQHSSLITLGNIAAWGLNAKGGGTNVSGLIGLVQGGVMEGTLGFSWSAETWSGFATTKAYYQFCMGNTAAPHDAIFHHAQLAPNGSDPVYDSSGSAVGTSAPYQALRYGLAFALMDDGYYATTQAAGYYDTARNWFDEFAVDPQTGVALQFPSVDAGLGYLGQPTDAPWPAPLSTGVYERHFRNAATGVSWVVLLDPKGNGAQTVQLGQSMQKITGTQDPTVNDGSTVTQVTLQDRDGLILRVL